MYRSIYFHVIYIMTSFVEDSLKLIPFYFKLDLLPLVTILANIFFEAFMIRILSPWILGRYKIILFHVKRTFLNFQLSGLRNFQYIFQWNTATTLSNYQSSDMMLSIIQFKKKLGTLCGTEIEENTEWSCRNLQRNIPIQ